MSARYAWMSDALCAQADPELWTRAGKGGDTATPKRICGSCPVQPQCRAHADTLHRFDGLAPAGIWGGRSHRQRTTSRTEQQAA